MLVTRQRWGFCLLVALLFVAGLMEMGGMLFIFEFISGLRVDAETGLRSGRLVFLLERAYGGALPNDDYALLAGAAVILVLFVKNALGIFVGFGLTRFLMKINQRVSESLFEGYLLTPYDEVSRRGVSGLTSNIQRIFDVFGECFSSVALVLVDGAMLSMVAVLLLVINPGLTLGAALLFTLIGMLMYWVMQRSLSQMGKVDRVAREDAAHYLSDGIQGLVDVRLRDRRPVLTAGYARALQQTAMQRRRIDVLKRLPRSVNELSLAFMIVGAVFFLTFSGGSVAAALPTLGIFGFAGLRMTAAMTRINGAFQSLKRLAGEFERFYKAILSAAPQTFGESAGKAATDYLTEERAFKKGEDGLLHDALDAANLTFTYEGAKIPAVKGVSVCIKKGQFVSFCGPSGGGKSTLVLLLLGLLKPQKGTIRCDGWNVYEHIRAWHANVGYVGQQMYISKRAIRENIAFAVPPNEIDDQRVWQALRLASAEDFVKKLPKRLAYVLAENGSNLSGGQRQRIIIARALYNDPDIVVFDEATAALDNATEREITAAIQSLSGIKTVICVAHRLSTIRNSDEIHVVKSGRITASGSYDELLESSDTFKNLAFVSSVGEKERKIINKR